MTSQARYNNVNKIMSRLKKAYIIKPDHPSDVKRMRKILNKMLNDDKPDDILLSHALNDVASLLSGEETLFNFFSRHPDEDRKKVLKTFIDEQLEVLEDMLILRSRKDSTTLRKFLQKFSSEIEIGSYLLDLKKSKITFDEFCERHGLREKS